MDLKVGKNKSAAWGFLQIMRSGCDLNKTQQNWTNLKVELGHRASCTLQFQVAPERTWKFGYGIGLLESYAGRSSLNGTQNWDTA